MAKETPETYKNTPEKREGPEHAPRRPGDAAPSRARSHAHTPSRAAGSRVYARARGVEDVHALRSEAALMTAPRHAGPAQPSRTLRHHPPNLRPPAACAATMALGGERGGKVHRGRATRRSRTRGPKPPSPRPIPRSLAARLSSGAVGPFAAPHAKSWTAVPWDWAPTAADAPPMHCAPGDRRHALVRRGGEFGPAWGGGQWGGGQWGGGWPSPWPTGLNTFGAGSSFCTTKAPHSVDPPPRQQRSQGKGKLKAVDLWPNPWPQEARVSS